MIELILMFFALLICIFLFIEVSNGKRITIDNSGNAIVNDSTHTSNAAVVLNEIVSSPVLLALNTALLPKNKNLHGEYDAIIKNNITEKFPKEYSYTNEDGTVFTIHLDTPLYPEESRSIKVHINGTLKEEGIDEIPLFFN